MDREKKWDFVPKVKVGDQVTTGDILGTVQETTPVEHRVMVPVGVEGEVVEIYAGPATVVDVIAKIKTQGGLQEVIMMQKWPVRHGRPYVAKLPPEEIMTTGQRVIDMFFPVAKGGTDCIPGPFGSGKTVVQHQLAKWADAEIVVYIGCGERGNEMTDAAGVPAARGPQERRTVDEAHSAHCQHLQHAGGSSRSIGLYRYHHRRVFP